MPRSFALIVLFAATSACVTPDAFNDVTKANAALQSQLAALRDHQTQLEGENGRLREAVNELGQSSVREAEFNKKKAELEALIAAFQKGGIRAVDGVDVFRSSEGVVLRMQGEVLFNSGQAVVIKSGQATLRQLLTTIRDHIATGKSVRIDGHTDTDPIRHSTWKTNWRLSAERAMAVVGYLAKNGIPAPRIFFAGFGEHRPTASGNDDAAKRRNRRVEILLAD